MGEQEIQDFVAQKDVKEVSESVIGPDSSAVDDAVEYCVFLSAAGQAQRYSGYFVPVVRTRFQHPQAQGYPCYFVAVVRTRFQRSERWGWSEQELHTGLTLQQRPTKCQQQQIQLEKHLHNDNMSDMSLKAFFWHSS